MVEKIRRSSVGSSNLTITSDMVDNWMSEAREEFKRRKILEKELLNHQLNRIDDQSPSFYHQQVTTLNPEIRNISDSAVVAETSVHLLLTQGDITIEQVQSIDGNPLLREWVHCAQQTVKKSCRPQLNWYRSLDGTCNNLDSPMQGASNQPFRRILPPIYDDGFMSPRTKSVLGNQQFLPLSREVSRRFTDSSSSLVVETKLSMLFLTWGQFLDHDMTNTGSTKGMHTFSIIKCALLTHISGYYKGENGSAITCCDQCKECSRLHPQCFPIRIEKADPFYGDKGVECLDFVRSAPAPQCQISKKLLKVFFYIFNLNVKFSDGREQFNQATAYIDGSMIYATTQLESDVRLMAHANGNLRGRLNNDGRWMLPIAKEANDGCNREEQMKKSRYCFKAGKLFFF